MVILYDIQDFLSSQYLSHYYYEIAFIIMYTEFPNILYPKLINFSKDNIECDFLRIRNRIKFSQGNYPWNVEKKYCRERKAQLEESVKKE